MAKTQNATLWKRATNTAGRRAIVGVGIAVVAILIGWGAAEYSYQLRVQKLVSAVDNLGSTELKPLGGSDLGHGVGSACPHFHDWVGSHFDDRGPCPTAAASWLAPVAQGQEQSLISSILKDAGYSVVSADQRTGGGLKNGIGVDIELTGLGDNKEPYPAPAGKVWTRVNLDAQEQWKK